MARAGVMPNVNSNVIPNLLSQFTRNTLISADQDQKFADGLLEARFNEAAAIRQQGRAPANTYENTLARNRANTQGLIEAEEAGVGPQAVADARAAAAGRLPPKNVQAKGREIAQYIIQRHGWTPLMASAYVGNAISESSLNPGAQHDPEAGRGYTGFGIFGFRDPKPGVGRRTELIRWARANDRDPGDLMTQVDFGIHEMNTSERSSFERLKAARTPNEANAAMIGFLRPSSNEALRNTAGRLQNSVSILAGIQGGRTAINNTYPDLKPASTSRAQKKGVQQVGDFLVMSKSDMDQLTAAQPGLRGMFEQDLNADSVIANGVNSWKINRSKYEAFLQSRAQGTAAGGSAQKAPQAPGQTQPKTKEQVSAFGTRGDQEFSDVSPAGADSAQAFKPVDDDEEEPTDWSE